MYGNNVNVIMEIEYWRKERNIRIGQIQLSGLQLRKIQNNVEFKIENDKLNSTTINDIIKT